MGLLALAAVPGTRAQGAGDEAVVARVAAPPATSQEIRIVWGERPFSVEALIRLDQYRIARTQVLDQIDWERTNVQRARALEELALADYRNHFEALQRLFRELQAQRQRAERGEASGFAVLKGLQQEAAARFEELDLVAAAYAESLSRVAGLVTQVQEMKRRMETWTFRVVRAEGVLSEGVTLADIAADATPTLETLMAELSALSGPNLNESPEVVAAVATFGEAVWADFKVILHDYDALGSRYRFFEPGSDLLKAEVDRGLTLMNFLRQRFGVVQGIPEGCCSIVGGSFLTGRILRTKADILSEIQDLNWRLAASGNTSGLWNGRGYRIREWVYARLIDQGERELALVTVGREAERVERDLPADIEDQVRAALTRQPPSEISRAFRGAMLAILSYRRRAALLSQRYARGDLPSFEELLRGDQSN